MNELENIGRIKQYDKILILLCAGYVVIPAYFKIVGISFSYICCMMVIAFGLGLRQFNMKFQYNRLTGVLLLWLGINTIVYLVHAYFWGAVWNFLIIAAGIIVGNTIKDRRVFTGIILQVIYVTGIVCIFGIVESLSGFNIWKYFNNSGAVININPPRFGLTRIVSFAYQTISYGTYLVMASCLAMYLLYIKETISKKQKNYVKICYVLIVINLLLTISRSVILIFIVSQVMLLYGLGAKKLLKKLLNIFILGVAALVVFSLIAPKVFEAVQNVYYMMMAIFDSDYTSLIASSFGKDNLNAVGTRLDIYKWTYEKVAGRVWFGVGFHTPFSYMYDSGNAWHTMIEKTAIEVEYLLTFYESGYIGLISEVIVFFTVLLESYKGRKKTTNWEGKLGFNYLMFVIISCMIVQYFMVNQSSEQNLFFLIIGLFLAYNNNRNFVSRV